MLGGPERRGGTVESPMGEQLERRLDLFWRVHWVRGGGGRGGYQNPDVLSLKIFQISNLDPQELGTIAPESCKKNLSFFVSNSILARS